MNVVLITIDTVRPDHLGCYGYLRARTPNIDRIAGESVVFTQAITNGSYTKPAFPAILSSTYASMYGGPFAAVGEERPMLAKILRTYGYRTAGFSSNPLLGTHIGYNEGFEVFEEPVPPAENRAWLRWKGVRRLLRSAVANWLLMKFGVNTSPRPVYVAGDQISDLAINWLETQKGPFFIWVHYMDAHWPYHIGASLQTGQSRAQAWNDSHITQKAKTYPGTRMAERLKQLYDTAIEFLDLQIGRLINRLDRCGFASNTFVIIVADHGEGFYEHGRWGHGAVFDLHDEILRVPLIIKAPGVPKKERIAQQVCLLDIAPTVLDLLGIAKEPLMEGQSLLPLLATPGEWQRRIVICEMVDLKWYCVALRTEQYKYIYDERRPSYRELYDLRGDPNETRNLYGSRPEIEMEFERALQRHLQRVAETSYRDVDGAWQRNDQVIDRLRALGYIE